MIAHLLDGDETNFNGLTYQGIPSITVGRDDVGLDASLKQDTTREIVCSAVTLSVSIQGASWSTASRSASAPEVHSCTYSVN